MANKFQRIGNMEYQRIKRVMEGKSAFIAEGDGKEIADLDDYLSAVWGAFKFPRPDNMNFYSYIDWICDLDWLSSNSYVIAILNSDSFMLRSPKERQLVFDSLEDTVLPWWEGEIEQHVVGGKAKPFDVYLVD